MSSRMGTFGFDLNYYKRDQSGMRLDVSSHKRLYGRDNELKELRDIYLSILPHSTMKGRTQHKPRRVCLVHGLSGTGKTVLCKSALLGESSTEESCFFKEKLFFIEGKYNQLYSSTTTPYSAIVDAFDQLGLQLQKQHIFPTEMKEFLQFGEGSILTKFIPSFGVYAQQDVSEQDDDEFKNLLGPNDDNKDGFMLASERLAVAFRSFLRLFTLKVKPLVLFLDDLHWSDRFSQELIASILHDDELKNFLLVGAFRDGDPDFTRGFLNSVQDLEVTDMVLHDLDCESVNRLLASVLSAEPERTEALALVVHRKTNGNPYFVTQLLEQLHSRNFLKYNFASLMWEWDLELANAGMDLSDNVVDVVASRLQGIPSRVQRVLKLAACLGYYVEVDVLRKLDLGMARLGILGEAATESEQLDERRPTLQSSLRIVVSDSELLEPKVVEQRRSSVASDEQRQRSSLVSSDSPRSDSVVDEIMKETYEMQLFEAALQRAEEESFVERSGSLVKFSHDRIQQCVYELVEMGCTKEFLHHQIGKYLKDCYESTTDSNESVRFLLLAVDQLNRGSSLSDDEEERLALIKLNYEASKIVKTKAGVQAISSFLRQAIELAQPSFWLFYYDLMLEVFSSSAEVDFSLGMKEEAKATILVIMKNALRETDIVRALVVKYQMFGVQCQYQEALNHACCILELLGEPLPKKFGMFQVMTEYLKARRACKNKSDEFFAELPPTESSKMKMIQKILQVGSVYGWNSDVNFAGFVFLRAIRITVREGWSEATPYIYSGYGFMLGLFGDYNEAFRFGQLALKARRGKESFPSSCPLTYTSLIHLQLPLSVALEPFLSGYRLGLESGDLFFGTICISCYALIHVACGLPLGPFADDLRNFGGQLRICHQDVPLAFILPTHQLALNLMGQSDDPLDLSRDALRRNHDIFSENLLLCDEASGMVPQAVLYMWYLQLYNAYILEDVVMVDKTLKRILALKKEARRFGGTHMMNYFLPFMDGLTGCWLAQKKPKSKTGPRVAKAAIAELTTVSKTRPVNSITLLKLLKAEAAARKKSTTTQQARMAYGEAISAFSRSGLNHFSAIANELAGKYMLEKGDQPAAVNYLEKAVAKWDEYNANVKVEQMLNQYPFLHGILSRQDVRSSSIQGRARFDATMDAFRSSTSSVDSVPMRSGEFESRRSGSNFDVIAGSARGSFRASLVRTEEIPE